MTARTRRGGGGFEQRRSSELEGPGADFLVNAEHRDEVALLLRPRRGER